MNNQIQNNTTEKAPEVDLAAIMNSLNAMVDETKGAVTAEEIALKLRAIKW